MKEILEKMKKNLIAEYLGNLANELSIEIASMDQKWEALSDDEKDYLERLEFQMNDLQDKIRQLKVKT